METKKLKYFKAKKQTNRFRKNQKVFVVTEHGNHADIIYKYRGKGRYVCGIISKWKDSVCGGFVDVIGSDGFKNGDFPSDFVDKLNIAYYGEDKRF